MGEENLIGEQKIRALFRKIILPGARIGVKSRGTKIYKTIEREPGVLTSDEERAVRSLFDGVRVQRWGAENHSFYIFFDE